MQGSIAVVRASYFEDCYVRGTTFGRRQDVPFQYLWPGPMAVEQWSKAGKCFLCNVSYSWLSPTHPDPNMFHLPRLVHIFAKFQKLWGIKDFGVILDFCSLWQPDGVRDQRSDAVKAEYELSLEDLNVPYGHRAVTSFLLTDVPPEEERKYDSRGWTLFEEIMIDSKGGDWNRWIFSNFDITASWTDAYAFFHNARLEGRKVPTAPEDFEALIEARRVKMESRGLDLFMKSGDQKRIARYYRTAFRYIASETKLIFDGVGWTDKDMYALTRLLLHYKDLEQLQLRNNKFGPAAAKELAATIPKLRRLQSLSLRGNPFCKEFPARLSIITSWQKAGKPQRLLDLGD